MGKHLLADAVDPIAQDVEAQRLVAQGHTPAAGDLVEDRPGGWTFLRPYGFATNTMEWPAQIRAGDTVRGAYGAASMTLLHEADIAAVAVRALTTDDHLGAKYELTGPSAITRIEQVATIGRALGRTLSREEITPERARQEMTWLPTEYADFVLAGLAAMVETPGPSTTTVEQVTGAPARTYAQWAADHVADFG
ncbi:hypothetical protein ACIBCD_11260 [Nocardia brasiliensis]|uniref:hypothetical protein n=1 Tax=Nocardia brasiliensis TaxID=37326 RepID=UPI0037B28915